MPNPFPVSIIDNGGVVRLEGEADFTDPANIPGGGSPAAPFKSGAGVDVPVLEDSSGNQLILGGDDSGGAKLQSADTTHWIEIGNAGVVILGLDTVTVQVGPPAGPYQTPLVYDSTAVTGGCYAWDGTAYQQVSNVVT